MKKITRFLLLPALVLALAAVPSARAEEGSGPACRSEATLSAAPALALPDAAAAAAGPEVDNPVCGSCSGSCTGLLKNARCYQQQIGAWGTCAAPIVQTCSEDGKLRCTCIARPIG
jgi:hypothetical protein